MNFEDVKVSGGFSFEITSSNWTSEAIVSALKEGTITMPLMIDGAPLYCEGRIIAKIVKALPKIEFKTAAMKFEKNTKLPYFFGFEDKAEVLSYFLDNEFFNDKEILIATKHMENDGYGNILIIVKDSDGDLYYTHIEDTIRTRNGPNKFYAENFIQISSRERVYLAKGFHFSNEYKQVLQELMMPTENKSLNLDIDIPF